MFLCETLNGKNRKPHHREILVTLIYADEKFKLVALNSSDLCGEILLSRIRVHPR